MKNIIWGIIVIVTIFSCSQNKNAAVSPKIEIGAYYEDGYVFYILGKSDVGYIEGETHGFIVSSYDIKGKYVWGCNYVNPTALGHSLGDGKQNTFIITDDCNNLNAASVCKNGWWLPNQAELAKLYQNSYILNNLSHTYWVSENISLEQATAIDFVNKTIIHPSIYDSLYIRPIKSF